MMRKSEKLAILLPISLFYIVKSSAKTCHYAIIDLCFKFVPVFVVADYLNSMLASKIAFRTCVSGLNFHFHSGFSDINLRIIDAYEMFNLNFSKFKDSF